MWAQVHYTLTQVHYTVDKLGEGKGDSWKGGIGYVTKDMAADHIPPPGNDTLILVCGPPPMYKAISGEKAKDKSQGGVLRHALPMPDLDASVAPK